jgi:dUTP pyrophosphatase
LQATNTAEPKQIQQCQDVPVLNVVDLLTGKDSTECLQVQRLTEHGQIPTRASDEAAGYDVYSSSDTIIPPQSSVQIPLDIAIQPPSNTYCQILSRSGLFTKHHIEAKIGTIDRDYTGNVIVLLQNNSNVPYSITKGDRIAQMVIYCISQPEITTVDSLHTTARGDKGFGSTGQKQTPIINRTTAPTMEQIIQEDGIVPPSIWLNGDPFHHCIDISIDIKGLHPTLGLLTKQMEPYHHRLQLIDMAKWTTAHKLPRWRSILRRVIILSVNQKTISNETDLKTYIDMARQAGNKHITIQFATITPQPLHPQGSLMLVTIPYPQVAILYRGIER